MVFLKRFFLSVAGFWKKIGNVQPILLFQIPSELLLSSRQPLIEFFIVFFLESRLPILDTNGLLISIWFFYQVYGFPLSWPCRSITTPKQRIRSLFPVHTGVLYILPSGMPGAIKGGTSTRVMMGINSSRARCCRKKFRFKAVKRSLVMILLFMPMVDWIVRFDTFCCCWCSYCFSYVVILPKPSPRFIRWCIFSSGSIIFWHPLFICRGGWNDTYRFFLSVFYFLPSPKANCSWSIWVWE